MILIMKKWETGTDRVAVEIPTVRTNRKPPQRFSVFMRDGGSEALLPYFFVTAAVVKKWERDTDL
jgi:hypothetical protein